MWRLMVISRYSVALLLVLVAALPQAALALTAGQVYEQVKDSVVVVKAFDKQGKPVGHGSGVVLPSGDIITNYHVIKGGVRYTVGRGKQAAPATLKGGDPDKDLCLLAAPGLVAEPVRLGKADRLKVGDTVYAVGAPQGLELSLSEGIISQLRGGSPHPIIQTTVAISPGSSGGGLFNAKGELVGITTFYLKEGQNLNFAVPVEWIAEVAGRKMAIAPKAPWFDQAMALQKAQDWQGMQAHCRRWTQAEPGNAVTYFNLGFAYDKLSRYGEAIEAYREGIRIRPDFAEPWYNLGVDYGKLGRDREKIEAFREALRLKPDFALAWNSLEFVYLNMGRYGEAIDAFREAVRLKPDDAVAWNNLAIAYAQSGNRSAALDAVQQLRRLNPKMADDLLK